MNTNNNNFNNHNNHNNLTTINNLLNLPFYINTIYIATEGEGIHVGRPQIFVRFQGCSIGCLNCDSPETWSFTSGGQSLSFSEISNKILDLSSPPHPGGTPLRRVSITGGDPLHPKHERNVYLLATFLKAHHFTINLEASGTRVVEDIFHLVDYISFDFKTPSTHVKTPLAHIIRLAHQYPGKFQIKSVISDERDFAYTWEAYQQVQPHLKPESMSFDWCLTPAYNTEENFPQERFQQILQLNHQYGGPFRVIGQQHKWIYGPNTKEV